jgi:hypothetical protein
MVLGQDEISFIATTQKKKIKKKIASLCSDGNYINIPFPLQFQLIMKFRKSYTSPPFHYLSTILPLVKAPVPVANALVAVEVALIAMAVIVEEFCSKNYGNYADKRGRVSEDGIIYY